MKKLILSAVAATVMATSALAGSAGADEPGVVD